MASLQLTQEERICAIVCDLAYAAHKDNGVKGQYSYDRARKQHQDHIERARAHGDTAFANTLSNYEVVNDQCNQNIVTIINRKEKKVIVGFRGTNTTLSGVIYDMFANDLPLIFNSRGGRRGYTALEHTKQVIKGLNPGYECIVTGHSLGGSNAELVSRSLNIRGFGYNTGSGFFNDLHGSKWKNENQFINNRIKGDLISLLHRGNSRHHDKKLNISPHSLSHFHQYETNNHNNNTNRLLGGIDLSGARVHAVLNHSINIGSISGAVFSGSIATLVADGSPGKSSTITMQDIAVALILAHFERDPAFSLDPWEPTNPEGPWLRCVYYPQYSDDNQNTSMEKQLPFSLAKTDYGRTLFEADWLLKQLSMGVNLDQYSATGPFPSPLPLRIFPSTLLNLGLCDQFDLESRQISSSNTDKNSRYTRLWITVNREETLEGLVPAYETYPIPLASCSEQMDMGSSIALRFSDVKLGVQVMRMTRGSTGELEDLSDPRLHDPTSSDVNFARLMTNHYDEVAQHYPPLKRLKELAKLQAIAKWMVENDVEIDVTAALKFIRESTSTAIEKVPALERKSINRRMFGGVNLSVRQKSHDRAPSYFTLEKNVQTELKNMVVHNITTRVSTENASSMMITLPFVKKKHCCVCDRPLDFASLFKPSVSSDNAAFCDEHHPDACFECMLPLYVDPTTRVRFPDGLYKFISMPNSTENRNDFCRYHPTCFLCVMCNTQIDNEPFVKHPHLLHVYYHSHCYSSIVSQDQGNQNNQREFIDSNFLNSDDEQIQLEQVLEQSKIMYELQQKSDQFANDSVPDQDLYSLHEHQYEKEDQWEEEELARALSLSISQSHKSSSSTQNNSKSHDHFQNQTSIPLSSEEEDRQLAEALWLSVSTTQTVPTTYNPVTSNSTQKLFQCPFCHNKFHKQIELEEHAQLHLDN